MTHRNKNDSRNHSRLNARPAQAGHQIAAQSQSQWQRKYDHYRNLAQATGGDDAVTRELYWQYAEHFLRLINGSAA